MDLRKTVGQGSPLRHSLHSQAMQQDRNRITNRSKSPYGLGARDPRDPRMEQTRDTMGDSRYMMRQTQELAGSSHLQDSIYKVDERHEELRRQIALKEKLLADMQSERESTRRLRYNRDPNPPSMGTMGSINRDLSHPGAPPVPGPSFGDPGRANYPLRSSPKRDEPMLDRPLPGYSAAKKSPIRSSQITRTGMSYEGTGRDHIRSTTSPDQQQLQFYPPHRSNFAKSYNQASPLRNRSKSGGGGSGSRSKSRSLSNNAGYRGSSERPLPLSSTSQRYPMRSTHIGSQDSYHQLQQPPLSMAVHRNETRVSPLRHQHSPPSPYRDNFVRPGPTEITLSAQPITAGPPRAVTHGSPVTGPPPLTAGPPRPMISEMVTAGPQVRDKLYVDRIEAMMMDNASLQRRLNGVSEDLSILKREREELINKLKLVETDNDRLNRITNQKDEVDMANQTMQDDLERTRNENREFESRVRNEQHDATSVGGQLNVANANKQNLVFESHNIEADLMKTLNRIDELRRAFDDVLREITESQMQIESLNAEDLDLNHANIELASAVARIQADRQDLNKRVQELTIVFDDTVRDKTYDRRIIDDKRKWQTKILTCKLLNQLILKQQRFQIRSSFRELHEYSNFDQNCHDKLKAFSMICYKVGAYRQKAALHEWYVNALKPLAFRYQNVDISYMIECNQIQARVFYAWRQYLNDKMTRYQHKTSSIDKTWYLLTRGVKQEKKRSFQIWKEKTRFGDAKGKTLRHLFRQKNDKFRRLAMQIWKSYNSEVEYAVRVHVLHKEATNKLLMSQVFQQLRIQTRFEKQVRLRTLAHCVKGWRDHLRYNRHLMHANMASIQFVLSNQKYTLKACFSELVRHKEQRRLECYNDAMDNDMNPGIKRLEEHNFEKSTNILTRSQFRASTIVRNMLGKRLFSYFRKWDHETQHYRVTMNDKVKVKLTQLIKNRFGKYFYTWKSNSFNKRNELDNCSNMMAVKVNEQLQIEAMENEKMLRFNEEFIRTTKRRLMDKTVRKLYYRQLSVAIAKWLGICKLKECQEERYQRVSTQMRKRFLRDAFNNYMAFFKWSRQHDLNIRGQINMNYKLNMKTKAKIFNALVFNYNRHQRAKRYWKKVLSRMDQYMKLRAVNIWKENANCTTEENLTDHQHLNTMENMKRKQILTEQETHIQEQENEFQRATIMHRNKTYKQLGNYFMRSYTSKTERAMKIWRQRLRDEHHKKEVLLRTINHWRKSQFAVVKRVFRDFVSQDRQNDSINEIKRKQIEQNAIMQSSTNGQELQEAAKEEADIAMRAIMDEANYRNNLTKKLMVMMERRNKEWIFVSQKRMIFLCWRHASKQQRAFIHSVVNVLDKSMKMKGFHYIKNTHMDFKYHDKVTRFMRKFVNKHMQRNGLDAFNKWKLYSLSKVDQKYIAIRNDLEEKDEAFLDHVDQIKEQNNLRCETFFITKNKANIYKAWVNYIKHVKHVKAKEQEFLARKLSRDRTLALCIWKQRVEKTKDYRTREALLIHKLNKRTKRAVMKGLKDQFRNVSDLTKNLSSLERMMRTKIMADSFKTISTFANSRQETTGNDKFVGSTDIIRMFRQAYMKGVQNAFFTWKNHGMRNFQQRNQMKSILTKISSHRLRSAFNNWRWAHNRAEVLDDQYYAGPERAEYWEAQRELENLQEFMRQEHYSEDHIQEYMKRVNWMTNGLMRKYIIRWRIKYTQKKYFPYIIDRWKQYVRIRKMVRYQFRFCQNQVHNVKSDLQRAFKKWKQGPDVLSHELSKLPLETLIDLGVRSTNQVGKCSEQLAENQSISNHLMIQRDEFLNYYIKSQVLAMALVKDRCRFSQMQSWSRWNGVRRKENRKDYHREIRDAAYLQANLELRKKELEEKNKELIDENADLGGFTTDGQIVKNNMNRVKGEVETLKEQIAETDPDFEQLMEENRRLKQEIIIAEQRAKNSKNNKFINTAGLKGAAPEDEQENQEPGGGDQAETESQRAQRERFERLQANAKGASIR